MQNPQISEFGYVLLFILGGIFFVGAGLITAALIRPHRPNEEKLSAYECGEEAIGSAWGQFNNRYYIIALIFILFDVEIVFLFPWATVFGQKELIDVTEGQWGWFALFEVFIFIGILVLGLAYVWAKGYLDWIKPKPSTSTYQAKVPPNLYEKVNQRTYQKASEPSES